MHIIQQSFIMISQLLFRFHHLHGRNARISNSGSTAARQNALSEFNEAIVMSNRALREGELFEIQVLLMI